MIIIIEYRGVKITFGGRKIVSPAYAGGAAVRSPSLLQPTSCVMAETSKRKNVSLVNNNLFGNVMCYGMGHKTKQIEKLSLQVAVEERGGRK